MSLNLTPFFVVCCDTLNSLFLSSVFLFCCHLFHWFYSTIVCLGYVRIFYLVLASHLHFSFDSPFHFIICDFIWYLTPHCVNYVIVETIYIFIWLVSLSVFMFSFSLLLNLISVPDLFSHWPQSSILILVVHMFLHSLLFFWFKSIKLYFY